MAEVPYPLTSRAERALSLAMEEARRYGRPYVGAEYLLLGLTDARDSTGARVLRHFGVDFAAVRSAVEMLTRSHPVSDRDQPEWGAPAKRVLELAVEEARLLQHHRAGTGHLLLGLVRENEGIPAGVLASMGMGSHNLEHVRGQVEAADQPGLL